MKKVPTGEQPMNINIKPEDLKPVSCDKCTGDLFLPSFKFKKVSRLLTGSPKDQIIPIEVFVCASCGTMLNELLPKELQHGSEEG